MPFSKHQKRTIELIVLFILFPVYLGITTIPLKFRLALAPVILVYIVYLTCKYRVSLLKKRNQIKPFKFWRILGFRLLIIAICTIAYLFFTDKSLLFKGILAQPLLWLRMIFIYTFFSVIPQEFLYRIFYFKRYRFLFKNQNIFFLINAFVFSMAHFMFHSFLILGITFIGGVIFAYTYHKTKSIFWVSVEHLIYGTWLFTVGMGKMIGFPI